MGGTEAWLGVSKESTAGGAKALSLGGTGISSDGCVDASPAGEAGI